MKSDFWAWIKKELEANIDATVNELAFGNLQFDNPQQFWELRAKAKVMKDLIGMPDKTLASIRNTLRHEGKPSFLKKLLDT
jgi:hypothetical protein